MYTPKFTPLVIYNVLNIFSMREKLRTNYELCETIREILPCRIYFPEEKKSTAFF